MQKTGNATPPPLPNFHCWLWLNTSFFYFTSRTIIQGRGFKTLNTIYSDFFHKPRLLKLKL